jgi:MoxR-like ATPase
MDIARLKQLTDYLRDTIGKVVMGQERVVDLMLTALLAEGHVLLEGVPGTAKTMLARTFASLIAMEFGRVQFTPDLLPGDLIGTSLFDFKTSTFTFTRGPIFTKMLLADEINRTPPKTQAALLEAMQERRVTTLDGKSHDLGPGFMVVATQNPIEQEGTYPLPEAQLDRFLFKISVDYPARDHERALVKLHGRRAGMPDLASFGLRPVVDLELVLKARATVQLVEISDAVIDYIVDLVRATRQDPAILSGASPRAAAMLAGAARAWAAVHGRGYVIPDDVQALAGPTLAHRVMLAPGAEIEGMTAQRALDRILHKLPVPR